MNETLFPKADREAEQRRALAKVYALLLRLAEEAEAKPEDQSNTTVQETTQEKPVDA